MPCHFCNFLTERNFVHYEDDLFWGMFDFNPVSPGHILIIPKRHVLELPLLNDQEWKQLKTTIQNVANHIQSADLKQLYRSIIDARVSENSIWFATQALNSPYINKKPNGYNHGVNDGTASGRTVEHLHWHIIPRFQGDMPDPRGGVRYVIPEMGNYTILRK